MYTNLLRTFRSQKCLCIAGFCSATYADYADAREHSKEAFSDVVKGREPGQGASAASVTKQLCDMGNPPNLGGALVSLLIHF